jgi:hypothetical protein
MSLLKLFRFFRPIKENLDPLSRIGQPSPPVRPEEPSRIAGAIAPFTGTRNVRAWLCEGDGSFSTLVHGESFYPVEIAAAIGARKPWKEECVFQVSCFPSRTYTTRTPSPFTVAAEGRLGT